MRNYEQLKDKIKEIDALRECEHINSAKIDGNSQQLLKNVVSLLNEINNQSTVGMDKLDVGLEMAKVYIKLQEIAMSLDIEISSFVQNQLIIDKAKILKNTEGKKEHCKPVKNKIYKVYNTFNNILTEDGKFISQAYIPFDDTSNKMQKVYVFKKIEHTALCKIKAIIVPRDSDEVIWVASDQKISEQIIKEYLKNANYVYDIKLLNEER